MALHIFDRVKQVTSSTGTGNITLGGTPNGFQSFGDVFNSGDTTYICIENGSSWEVSRATYGVAGSGTLSRDTILDSSTGAAINLSGRSTVFCTVPAAKYAYLDPSGEINLSLGGLSDATITSPATGNILSYNGSQWVNSVPDPGYSDEQAQDAIGSILVDSSSISYSYNDGTPSISASVRSSGVTNDMLATGIDVAKLGYGNVSSTELSYLAGVTSSLQTQLDSKYDVSNPSGYISASGVAAAYQPLDADLTSLASASGSGIYERSGGNWTPVVIGSGLSLGSGTLSNTLDLSSYLTSSTAESTYVPYTGATSSINIGSYVLRSNTVAIGSSAYSDRTNLSFSLLIAYQSAFTIQCAAGSPLTFVPGNGVVSINSSTTPTQFNLHNTYTSATSFENLQFKAVTGGAYQIGSAIGSAGGTNRSVGLGYWTSAGSFNSTVTVGKPDTHTLVVQQSSDQYNVGADIVRFIPHGGTAANTVSISWAGALVSGRFHLYDYASYISFTDGLGAIGQTANTGYPGGTRYSPYITAYDDLELIHAATRAITIGKAFAASPATSRLLAQSGMGTNIAGANLEIGAGKGTGTGAGGSLIFQTAPAGSSGTSANSLVTRLTIDSTGVSTFAGVVLASGGSQSNPGYSFAGNTGSGLYLIDSNTLAFISNGTKTFDIYGQYLRAFGRVVVGNSGAYCFTSGSAPSGGLPDVFIYGEAANTVALRNDTAAQTLRVYNTYTSATSFENLQFKANAGAAYQIGSAIGSAGGTTRAIDIGRWNSSGTWSSGVHISAYGDASVYSPTLSFNGSGSGYGFLFDNAIGTLYYVENNGSSNFSWYNGLFTTQRLAVTQSVSTSGSPAAFTVTGAAHTTLTTSTEAADINFNLARTVQFATGALTTQRAFRIQAPTYSFVGASTITTASTLSISGAPVAGTNATITNAYALDIEGGKSRFGGEINLTNASGQTLRIAMDTNNPVFSSATTRVIMSGTAVWLRTDGGVLFTSSSDSEMGRVSISSFDLTLQSNTNGSLTLTVPTSANSNQGGNSVSVIGQTALSSSTNVLHGGSVNITGGNGASASAGNAYGGDIVLTPGTGYGSGRQGVVSILGPITNTATGATEIRYGTTAQTLRVYNTYTSSTSGEWAEFNWATTSNVLRIGSNKGNSGGSARDVAIVHGGTVVANFLADRFYLGPIADSTATGGNARGQYAVDLQVPRGLASQVASGLYAVILGGQANTASGNRAICVAPFNSVASGDYGTIVGGSDNIASGRAAFIGAGESNQATNSYATIGGGFYGLADRYGQRSHAAGSFVVCGDAQAVSFILRNKTTNNTPTTLFLNGSSARLTIPSGKTMSCKVTVKGIKSDGSAKARFVRLVEITNVGGTTALDTAVEALGTDYNPSGCVCDITADNTNDALDISVTGITAETWRWVAVVEGLEIAYGT